MTAHEAFVMLDLAAAFNNDGISYPENVADGGFNVWGNTFPADQLPESRSVVEVAGVPFRFPPKEDGQPNNVVCCAQVLEVPPGLYDWIYVLGASERRSEDWVYLHYASGAVDPEWLRMSDFWPSAPHFGEVAAFRCHHMHYPRHVQADMGPVMWRQRVPVPRQEALCRLRLPDNVAIHLFALTCARSAGAAAARGR